MGPLHGKLESRGCVAADQEITKAQFEAKVPPRSSAPGTTDFARLRQQAEQAEAARAREERRRKEAERRLAALEKERSKATRRPKLAGTGTGFVVTSRGHVVTNNHVVEDCTETRVTPLGMLSVAAPRVFADSNNDVALLVARGLPTETATFRSSGSPVRQGEQATHAIPLHPKGGGVLVHAHNNFSPV